MADNKTTEQSIGERQFARVNELVEGGMNRTEAFETVGKEMDSKAGSVAANFYRVNRRNGKHGHQASAQAGRKQRVRGQRKRADRRQPQAPVAEQSNGSRQPDMNLNELADRLVQTAEEVAMAMRQTNSISEERAAKLERMGSILQS